MRFADDTMTSLSPCDFASFSSTSSLTYGNTSSVTSLTYVSASDQHNQQQAQEHLGGGSDDVGHVCGAFFFVIYGPCFGIVCGLGLVGNALSFAVLHRYSRDNVATYLLKSLALADNLLLLTGGTVQIGMGMALYFGYRAQLAAIYPYVQTYAWPAVQITQLFSVWMTVLVAANRYVAVCRPLHAPRLCTKRRVRIQIAAMVALVVLASTPRFFEHAVELRAVTTATRHPCSSESATVMEIVPVGLTTEPVYNILYENIFYCLFVFFLPLVVLVFFNFHLVNVLKQAKRSWSSPGGGMLKCQGGGGGGGADVSNSSVQLQQLGRLGGGRPSTAGLGSVGVVAPAGGGVRGRSGDENNITLVMAIIVLTFIVCETPATVNQFMFYVRKDDDFDADCSSYQRFFHICNLLVVINSSMNFVIYCLFRRQFQRQLLDLLCCRRRQPRQSIVASNGQLPLASVAMTTGAGRNNMALTASSTLPGAGGRRVTIGDNSCASVDTNGAHGGRFRRFGESKDSFSNLTETLPLRCNGSSSECLRMTAGRPSLYQDGSEDTSIYSCP